MAGLVSIIIPTHNRPHFLRECLASVAAQSYERWEAIIIDEASQPPANSSLPDANHGGRIRVIRNSIPKQSALARQQGAEAARGQFIVHLDDDDMLAPNALESAVSALRKYPDIDLAFLGTEGFGERSGYFNNVQKQATLRTIERGQGEELEPGRVRFGPELFAALLFSVPMSFQRIFVRLGVWGKVEIMRQQAYAIQSGLEGKEAYRRFLKPPLRDSEWSLYAASVCRSILLNRPLYQQRCEGQGAHSVPAQRYRSGAASIDIMARLESSAREMDTLSCWSTQIRSAHARAYFEHAYMLSREGSIADAYRFLFSAIKREPLFPYLRFALTMVLPRRQKP